MFQKLKNRKGFTLMEMLIVVAIIAVLVAIAIPTFNASLAKARAATDVANIRSGYAAAQVEAMIGDTATGTKLYLQKDGTVAATGADDYTCQGAAAKAADDATIGGVQKAKDIGWAKGDKIVYTVTVDGTTGDVSVAITKE